MKGFISFVLIVAILSGVVTLIKLIVAGIGVAITTVCLVGLLGLARS